MITLRKLEYYSARNNRGVNRLFYKYYNLKHYHLGMKCGFDIPPNTCGAGLAIHHWGSIIINSQAHIGRNCCMQQGIVVGFNGRNSGAPKIGNNVYIGTGAKILGDIEIADNCIIGANSIVTKSFLKPGSIIAGVPAREISKK